jgi:hypothetical protein
VDKPQAAAMVDDSGPGSGPGGTGDGAGAPGGTALADADAGTGTGGVLGALAALTGDATLSPAHGHGAGHGTKVSLRMT